MINDSTVTTYVSKKYKDDMKNQLASTNADVLEEMAGSELKSAVNDMKTVLPNVTDLIAPTLKTVFQIQKVIGDINITR